MSAPPHVPDAKASPPGEGKLRDRSRTALTILAAARTVLVEEGFAGLGVNAVARSAGCDKQLIYRYFGGLGGLAEALGDEVARDLARALADTAATLPASYAELVADLLDALIEVLLGDPALTRLIAWELAESNHLTRAFAEARGRVLSAWIARLRGDLAPPPGVDAGAANAVLIGAVQQIVLSGAASGAFAGLPLQSPADWLRLKSTIRALALATYRE